jgi:hypothetical protein
MRRNTGEYVPIIEKRGLGTREWIGIVTLLFAALGMAGAISSKVFFAKADGEVLKSRVHSMHRQQGKIENKVEAISDNVMRIGNKMNIEMSKPKNFSADSFSEIV